MSSKKQITPISPRESPWTLEITSRRGLLDVPVQDIVRYRDLLYLFVRRDFVAFYKQTILGPLWFLIQPILTTLMMTLVFGKIAGLSTDGLPKLLFYLAGITMWGYFSECLGKTATTFTANAHLFGKVYFPRLITPLASVISNLIKFTIQLALFLTFWGYFLAKGIVQPQPTAFLLPVLLVLMAMTSLGLGLIFSALTTKYRDLSFLLGFGIQLFMYATPVIYPVSTIPEKYSWIIRTNPVTPLIETFRHGFLGTGAFTWGALGYTTIFASIILVIGIITFNKVEATFMDTV
ncbi:ABC transporter permease [bacterium]|nr:ABC transporter permease [bacterium]